MVSDAVDEGVIPPNVCVVVVSADSNVAIDPYLYLQLESPLLR